MKGFKLAVLVCMGMLFGLSFSKPVCARVIDLSDGKIHSSADDSDNNYRSKAHESYGSNYQKGYKEGYTYNGGGIRGIPPVPPIPPIPNVGESEEDAYTRGILEGQRARRNR